MSSIWEGLDMAATDIVAERTDSMVTRAKVALAPVTATINGAATAEEFGDRMAVMQTEIDTVVQSVASTPSEVIEVHARLSREMEDDFEATLQEREAARRTAAAKAVEQRRIARQVAVAKQRMAFRKQGEKTCQGPDGHLHKASKITSKESRRVTAFRNSTDVQVPAQYHHMLDSLEDEGYNSMWVGEVDGYPSPSEYDEAWAAGEDIAHDYWAYAKEGYWFPSMEARTAHEGTAEAILDVISEIEPDPRTTARRKTATCRGCGARPCVNSPHAESCEGNPDKTDKEGAAPKRVPFEMASEQTYEEYDKDGNAHTRDTEWKGTPHSSHQAAGPVDIFGAPTPDVMVGQRVAFDGDNANPPREGQIVSMGSPPGYITIRWDDGSERVTPQAIFTSPRWHIMSGVQATASRRTAATYQFTMRNEGFGVFGFPDAIYEKVTDPGSHYTVQQDGNEYIAVQIELSDEEAERLYGAHPEVGMTKMGGRKQATISPHFKPKEAMPPFGGSRREAATTSPHFKPSVTTMGSKAKENELAVAVVRWANGGSEFAMLDLARTLAEKDDPPSLAVRVLDWDVGTGHGGRIPTEDELLQGALSALGVKTAEINSGYRLGHGGQTSADRASVLEEGRSSRPGRVLAVDGQRQASAAMPHLPGHLDEREQASLRLSGAIHAPYRIKPKDKNASGPFKVVNDKGETKGTHDTWDEARQHQEALYVNVEGAPEMAKRKREEREKAASTRTAAPYTCAHCGLAVGYDRDRNLVSDTGSSNCPLNTSGHSIDQPRTASTATIASRIRRDNPGLPEERVRKITAEVQKRLIMTAETTFEAPPKTTPRPDTGQKPVPPDAPPRDPLPVPEASRHQAASSAVELHTADRETVDKMVRRYAPNSEVKVSAVTDNGRILVAFADEFEAADFSRFMASAGITSDYHGQPHS